MTSTAEHEQSAKLDSTVFGKQTPLFGPYYINFPPPQKSIAICRGVVESFGKVIADVFPDDVRRWNVESLLEDVTDIEIESIREAHAFSKTSSSLFSLLVGCITCEAEHVARLHLSGFHTRQMKMLLGTGERDWISACFTQ
jgi:hypothetical protein